MQNKRTNKRTLIRWRKNVSYIHENRTEHKTMFTIVIGAFLPIITFDLIQRCVDTHTHTHSISIVYNFKHNEVIDFFFLVAQCNSMCVRFILYGCVCCCCCECGNWSEKNKQLIRWKYLIRWLNDNILFTIARIIHIFSASYGKTPVFSWDSSIR